MRKKNVMTDAWKHIQNDKMHIFRYWMVIDWCKKGLKYVNDTSLVLQLIEYNRNQLMIWNHTPPPPKKRTTTINFTENTLKRQGSVYKKLIY